MIVYSKKIIQFIQEIQFTIKEILSKEIKLRVSGNRFFDSQQYSYPIRVIIYNNKKMLGYFDSHFYEMGFHECLMHVSRKQLHDIIRHELAHYLNFIQYGEMIEPHGIEFRAFCEQMGWSKEVYQASSSIENEENILNLQESGIFRKIQKLMALATSSNKHEAEQAMLKSQQLLLKHHIELTYFEEEDEKVFLKRILKQKKENAKMRAIANILETFFVTPVYHRTEEFTYLEILGDAINIEIAEYVASVLDLEFDKLWNQAKKQANLKGMIAKNSFFLGLARGYCQKIQALKREYTQDATQALLIIEKKLSEAKTMAYSHLSSKKSKGNYCQKSSTLGEKMGQKLQIHPAIHRSSFHTECLLPHLS